MRMNEDILHLVTAQVADRPTLTVLCRVASSIGTPACKKLYRVVRIRRLSTLQSFASTVEYNSQLARYVISFIELIDSSRFDMLMRQNYAPAVLQILRALKRVETVCLSVAKSAVVSALNDIIALLGRRTSLRNLSFGGVGHSFISDMGALEALEISASFSAKDELHSWLRRHCFQLRILRVLGSWDVLTLPGMTAPIVFPAVHTIGAERDNPAHMILSPAMVEAFPALVSLSLADVPEDMVDLDLCWPKLKHLEITLRPLHTAPSNFLSRGHRVPSLRVRLLRLGITMRQEDVQARQDVFSSWASPHVRCLSVDWPIPRWFDQLREYTGLETLDVRFDGPGQVKPWFRRLFTAELSVQNLAVLTVRYLDPTHRFGVDMLPTDKITSFLPALRLVRVDCAHGFVRRSAVRHAWRFSSGTVHPLDWRSACEMTAGYLPHWYDTHAPWDDIEDI